MLLEKVIESLSKLPPERLQMIYNFSEAAFVNQQITRCYNVVLEWNEPDEDNPDGGYTVLVPTLPPVVTEGDTREEALSNIREAILCYLEYLLITEQPIPESDKAGKNLVEVTV
jgi:predicted RNase H-like HicB family nuclease